ncbi:hypothetical protein K438DRAFT_2022573 [Mycena galopus ATCC 62051]|nr:hypothetical protein K438DRAFT_2022573 [Mycena galopus ATCC 62051]
MHRLIRGAIAPSSSGGSVVAVFQGQGFHNNPPIPARSMWLFCCYLLPPAFDRSANESRIELHLPIFGVENGRCYARKTPLSPLPRAMTVQSIKMTLEPFYQTVCPPLLPTKAFHCPKMHPYFELANEYMLLEHELGRSECFPHQHYYRPSPTPPPLPVLSEKPRSVSTKSSRSSIKSESKPKPKKTAAMPESELETFETTLSCLAVLFQGMYTTTLCRLMLE